MHFKSLFIANPVRGVDSLVAYQGCVATGTTDSEMFIADAIDEDPDLDANTATSLGMQRGSGDSEKRLVGSVAPFIERNPDKMASTLEWRGGVLHARGGHPSY